MERCVSTYISAQYCTTTFCNIPGGGGDGLAYYRIEYADSLNHAPCSVSYMCRCPWRG